MNVLGKRERVAAARIALEGLSVGDAAGRQEFLDATDVGWRYSDDTEMGIALLQVLDAHGAVDQDALAAGFARRFERDPERGYGAVAYWLLFQLANGRNWRSVSTEIFGGQGSLGNGAAMRVAPVGAYFADDLREAAQQARLSAAVTHAHPDGQAGAVAVAVAAACAATNQSFFEHVLAHTPPGPTRDGLVKAASLAAIDPVSVAALLGDGTDVRSSDTVPLALWCAAQHMGSYEQAIRLALAACHRRSADRDTVCAIVGSIVVLAAGIESIPPTWRSAREPLDI
jgi:ADP-ribosylglycohydrolase